jgi:hypothetical protein
MITLISIPFAFALGAYWRTTLKDFNNDKKVSLYD